jgi:drug/metabolite transporter (DMT)-like permease
MTADRPLVGIMLMLGFCLFAPMGDALAKALGDHIPVGQLVTVRFAVQVLILAPILLFARASWHMTPFVLKMTALRTVLHIVGLGAMFLSLTYLPLADAVAIAFVMPFIMLLLGWYFLGEEVGQRRLIACGIGFIGTLMVVQPSFISAGWAALLPLLVAIVFSLFMLVTRQIAKETDPILLQCVSGVMACILLLPAMLVFDGTGLEMLDPVTPTLPDWGWFALLGALGTVAHLLMTWSLRYAPTSTLAPMQYLEIPIATVIGWLVFREFPNGLALLGILVTISAGLYIVMRERRLSLDAAQRSPEATLPSAE